MGPLIIVVVLVVVIPVGVLLSGMAASALFSFLFPKDAEDNASNPELVNLN